MQYYFLGHKWDCFFRLILFSIFRHQLTLGICFFFLTLLMFKKSYCVDAQIVLNAKFKAKNKSKRTHCCGSFSPVPFISTHNPMHTKSTLIYKHMHIYNLSDTHTRTLSDIHWKGIERELERAIESAFSNVCLYEICSFSLS